jgi:hypothetical protein
MAIRAFILSIIAIIISSWSLYINYRAEDRNSSWKLSKDLYFNIVHPLKLKFSWKYRRTIEAKDFLNKYW